MTPQNADPPVTLQSEDWYRQVLETAPDAMVIVGDDERILFVNRQTERLFGYVRADLIGKKLDTLIPERLRPSHSNHVARFFSRPGTRPMGSGVALFGRQKDGTEVPIEVSLSPLHTDKGLRVSAAIRDITERRRTEAAERLASDRLASAVESIQDAIALFDADDHCILCNSAFRQLAIGSIAGPLIGKTRTEIRNAWLEHLAFESDEEKLGFQTRHGSALTRQTSSDVRTIDGRSLRVTDRRTIDGGVVRTVWDLTDDVQLSEDLREARAAAEAASAAKSEFLSSMSHELRTPLNAVLGFAQLLRRDKKDPLSEKHLDRVAQILKGGEHLLRLIDDILDLSRIEAGGLSLSVETVSIEEILSEVCSTLEPMVARSGLTLVVTPPARPAPLLKVDRVRCAQILMNFGSNAIKYNRPGGRVTFSLSEPEPGLVRVEVTDTGIGIPVDKQTKLFQPFQRAGQETGPIEGTGIGLVITKRLVELMGGRVGFESVDGEGSKFWVDFPLQGVESVGPPAPKASAHEQGLRSAHRSMVLYVEDNPANVLFMRDLLSTFDNIELSVAPTAEIGVELARAKQPAVIIMDINLPGMSGLDALNALRALPDTRHIPVIALTAAASERDRQRGAEAGFFRYLTKPIQVNELEAAIGAIVGTE